MPRRLLGARSHTVEPIEFLAPQISSPAELTYADISRRVEVAFAQDDFSGGIAKRLRFALERSREFRYSKGIDTSYANALYPGPKITTIGSAIAEKPSKAVQRGDVTYLAAAAKLYQVTTSGATLDTTFAATITDLFVWGGNLVVGLGSSTNFEYRASDVSGGAFTGGGAAGHFFAATEDLLWRAVRPNSVLAADQISGPWASYDVGDSSYNITSLFALENALLIAKEDGLHGLSDQGVATNLTPELRLQADAQVGKAGLAFNRDAYFTSRVSIVRVRPSEGLSYIGLDLLADPKLPGTPPDPRPASFTTDGRFLYALVVPSDGTDGVYVWKLDYSGNWHNYLWRSDLGDASDLLYATGQIGATDLRAVLFAYASGANWQLAYARWPLTADPAQDTTYEFETALVGSLRTLDYVASFATVKKYSDRFKGVSEDLSDDRKWSVYAWLDDESTRKLVGNLTKSPDQELTLDDPFNFHRLSLEFDGKADAATTPPLLRAFHLSTRLLPRVVRKHTIHLLAVSALPLTTGGRGRNRWEEIVERLRDLRESQDVIECEDEHGRQFKGYLEDIAEYPLKEPEGPGQSPQVVVSAVLVEVARAIR